MSCAAILVVIITLFLPPVGVAIVAGCGADLCINILLTILGYFPGHIHAFYVEYQYYKRRGEARAGIMSPPAPGIYSDKVNNQPVANRGVEAGYVQPMPAQGV